MDISVAFNVALWCYSLCGLWLAYLLYRTCVDEWTKVRWYFLLSRTFTFGSFRTDSSSTIETRSLCSRLLTEGSNHGGGSISIHPILWLALTLWISRDLKWLLRALIAKLPKRLRKENLWKPFFWDCRHLQQLYHWCVHLWRIVCMGLCVFTCMFMSILWHVALFQIICKGWLTLLNGKLLRGGSKYFWFVLSTESLTWYRDDEVSQCAFLWPIVDIFHHELSACLVLHQ